MKNTLFVGLLLTLFACENPPTKLGNLDLATWRTDRNGCSGLRMKQLANFKAISQSLKGKSSNEISALLSRPDVNQLADRNQKFYVYFLETGPQCAQRGAQTDAQSVALRMSAVGLVTEITYQNGMP